MTDIIERPATRPRPTNQRRDVGDATRVLRLHEDGYVPTLRLPVTARHAKIEVPETIGVVDRPAWDAPAAEHPSVARRGTIVVSAATQRRRPPLYAGQRRAVEPLWMRLAVMVGSALIGGALAAGAILGAAVTW